MSGADSEIVQVSRQGQATVVKVSGEIDLHHSPVLNDRLIAICRDKPPLIVVDLARVEYMDSSGVGTLVHAYRLVKQYGGRMILAGMTDRVRGVFEISRLDHYFQICRSVEEAISS